MIRTSFRLLTSLSVLAMILSGVSCGGRGRDVDRMYDRSYALVRMRMVNEALELLEKAREIEPERYDILRLYWQLRFNRDEGAVYELKNLEIEHPDNPLYPRLLSSLLAEPHERLEAGRRAMKLQPENDEIYRSIGDVFGELEMTDSAAVYYSKAVGLNPSSTEALLAMARIQAGKADLDEAERIYGSVIERTGSGKDHDKAFEEFFYLHWEKGDTSGAVRIARSALSKVSDPWLHNDLAWVLGDAKIEMALVESLAIRSIEGMNSGWIRSEYPEIDEDWAESTARQFRGYVYDTLGGIYQKGGETENAIAAFEKAVELIPFISFDLLTSLSKAYREAGRYEDAIGSLLDILSVSMDDQTLSTIREVYAEMHGDTTGLGSLVEERRRETIEPAADFRMASLSGGMVSLSDLRGNVVLLNFWFPT